MRIFKILLAIFIALILFVAVDSALTLVLEPYGSKSQLMWEDYGKQKSMQTAIVGTSLIGRGVDPEIIDEQLNTTSFNMATPKQSIEESEIAIKTAYEDYGIQRVILGINSTALSEDATPNPGSAFMWWRIRAVSFFDTVSTLSWELFSKGACTQNESINCIFPWASHHVKYKPEIIYKNVLMKLNGTSVYDAAQENEPNWIYKGKGYGSYKGKVNYDEREDLETYLEGTQASANFDQARVDTLNEICSYCAAHNIELICIGAPLSDFSLMDWGQEYYAQAEKLRACLAHNNLSYYDFNLASSEFLSLSSKDYSDGEHLNLRGGAKFSVALAELVAVLDTKADADELFISSSERLSSLNYIAAVLVEAYAASDGIHIEAQPIAGAQVACEYRYWVRKGAADTWQLVCDYTPEAQYTYAAKEKGSYDVKVEIRARGSNKDFEHYRTTTLVY